MVADSDFGTMHWVEVTTITRGERNCSAGGTEAVDFSWKSLLINSIAEICQAVAVVRMYFTQKYCPRAAATRTEAAELLIMVG